MTTGRELKAHGECDRFTTPPNVSCFFALKCVIVIPFVVRFRPEFVAVLAALQPFPVRAFRRFSQTRSSLG